MMETLDRAAQLIGYWFIIATILALVYVIVQRLIKGPSKNNTYTETENEILEGTKEFAEEHEIPFDNRTEYMIRNAMRAMAEKIMG